MKKLFIILAMLLFSTTCYGWSDNDYSDEDKAIVADALIKAIYDIDGNGVVDSVDTGGSMTYPGAGIAVSTGSAWDTSITNNSANWDSAYGWGDHSTAGYLTAETDPDFASWLSSFDPFENSDETDPVFAAWLLTTPPLFVETDATFTSWDKSTGISITESQISDFGTYLESETDPTVDLTKLQSLVTNDFHNLGGTDNAGTDDQTASEVSVIDTNGRTDQTTVEGWLDEIASWFSTGLLTHEHGGLEADVSAYSGVPKITGGATGQIKYNFGTSVAPDQDDDVDGGWSIGSKWYDTTADAEYTCLDTTDGAAVWSAGGGGGTPDDGSVTTAKIAAGTLVVESEGIASNDNDTTVATNAAIIDYVAANAGVFNWAGDWAISTGYNVNDCVGNEGSGYICIANNTSGSTTEPGVGAAWETYWNVFVAKGDTGVPGTNTFSEVDVSSSQTLSTTQCSSGAQHNNYGQSDASVQNVPAAFEGGYFCVICTTIGQDLSYSPYSGTAFYLTNGGSAALLSADEDIQNTTTAMMDQIIFRAVRTGSGVFQWNVIVLQGAW